MNGPEPAPDSLTLGGGDFIGVRLSNEELQPFWGADLRFGPAALVFIGIVLGLRLRRPRGAGSGSRSRTGH